MGGIQGNDLVSEHLLIREDPSSTDAVEDGPGIAHIDCRPVDGLVIGWRLLKEVGHLKSLKSVEDEYGEETQGEDYRNGWPKEETD